jgi:GMP synthase-like glutamine amidotransferase
VRPILIFRHVACEGPGYLGTFLEARGVAYRVVAVDAGEPVPAAPEAPALVFMGGPMSVNDPLPWVEAELALIRRAVDAGVPVLGHCLGGQLISKALGAPVGPNPVKEIGWHPVTWAPGPGAAAWRGDLPETQEAFHWHGETFALPAGADLLLSSGHCPHQAYAIGTGVLALQCHVEMLPDMVREWSALYADEVAAADSPAVQDGPEMARDLDARCGALNRVADALYARWLGSIDG